MTHKFPEVLKLKKGAEYYLTANVNVKKRLVNGTVCIFDRIAGEDAVVLYSPAKDGNCDTEALIPLYENSFRFHSGQYALCRVQYPLRLGYAATIHFTQGSTLDAIVFDMRNVIASAQVYVALSRVRSLEDVYIIGFSHTKIRCLDEVKQFYGDKSILAPALTKDGKAREVIPIRRQAAKNAAHGIPWNKGLVSKK